MAMRLSAANALRVMIDGAASAIAPAPALLKMSRRVVFMAIILPAILVQPIGSGLAGPFPCSATAHGGSDPLPILPARMMPSGSCRKHCHPSRALAGLAQTNLLRGCRRHDEPDAGILQHLGLAILDAFVGD